MNRSLRRFFLATGAWSLIPAAGVFVFRILVASPLAGTWTFTEAFYPVVGWIGLFLPFAAFAGGLTASRRGDRGRVAGLGLLVAVLAYGMLAYGAPVLRARAGPDAELGVGQGVALGPNTPGNLRARRTLVEAYPPAQYSFSTDRPLERPPNWLTYGIQSLLAISLFAVFSALLGHQVGLITAGRSPPIRQNTRWALGIFCSVAFLGAASVGEDWVRADPGNSPILAAWTPLLVPILLLVLFALFGRRKHHHLHARTDPGV